MSGSQTGMHNFAFLGRQVLLCLLHILGRDPQRFEALIYFISNAAEEARPTYRHSTWYQASTSDRA